MSPAEWLRKACHMAAFGPALLLPWLTPAQALWLAAALVAMNSFALPRFLPRLYRPGEPGGGALEIILYPVAAMAAVSAYGFPSAAASGGKPAWYLVPALAWFVLAVCDAWAGIGSRLFRRGPALPWNRRKTAAGSAFGLLASAACLAALIAILALAGWPIAAAPSGTLSAVSAVSALSAPSALADLPLLPVLGALAATLAGAALLETIWFGIADNLILPFAVCAAFPLLSTPLFPAGGNLPVSWPLLAAPAAFGILAYATRTLTAGGAALGTLLAFALIAAEPRLFAFLGGFFALAVAATRWRFQGKAARRIAEDRDGKRGAAQVFGAMGAAVWMTPLVHQARWPQAAFPGGDPASLHGALLVCAAPFIAKVMDTVSSEVGKAVGGRTVSLRGFRPVAPGTEGAVSLAGTLGGLLAAALLASAVPALGWGGLPEAACLVGIAAAANLFESCWGEWSVRRGIESGPHANFLMTLAAALLAWLVWIA